MRIRYSEITPNVFACENKQSEDFAGKYAPAQEVTSGWGGMVWRAFERKRRLSKQLNKDSDGSMFPEEFNDVVFQCGMKFAYELLMQQGLKDEEPPHGPHLIAIANGEYIYCNERVACEKCNTGEEK